LASFVQRIHTNTTVHLRGWLELVVQWPFVQNRKGATSVSLIIILVKYMDKQLPESSDNEDDDLQEGDEGGPHVQAQYTTHESQEIIKPL
jgi:hypothetical protein